MLNRPSIGLIACGAVLTGIGGCTATRTNLAPSHDSSSGCGSIWLTKVAADSFAVAVRPNEGCGGLHLVSATWRRPDTIELAIRNDGPPVRLPILLFIPRFELRQYHGDSVTSGRTLPTWFEEPDRPSGFLLDWKRNDEARWRFVRSARDTIVPRTLRTGESTSARSLQFRSRLRIDSLHIPYRIKAYQPAPPVPLVANGPPRPAPRDSDWIDDPGVFPLPVLRNIIVVGFRPGVPRITRQLVMDRLQGTVVGGRRHSSGIQDYFVHLGPAWQDSMFRSGAPLRKLGDGVIARFGYYTSSTRQSRVVPDLTSDSVLVPPPCRPPADGLHWRRVFLVLVSPTPAESAQVLALTAGRWAGSFEDDPDDSQLDIPGTRADAERLFEVLSGLPQVSYGTEYISCAMPMN